MNRSGLPPLGAVPIKAFGAAKQRLAAALAEEPRRIISRRLAEQTLAVIDQAGLLPLIMTIDQEVVSWAGSLGVAVLTEGADSLDGAAAAAVERARSRGSAWLICHADLPLIRPNALIPAVTALSQGQAVIAPSKDGGTTLIGGLRPDFAFSYGPGSFHRHLRRLGRDRPLVLVGPALAIDLDHPADLAALSHRIPWLKPSTDTLAVP